MTEQKIEIGQFVEHVIRENKADFLDFIESAEDHYFVEFNHHALRELVDAILAAEFPSQEALDKLALLLPHHLHIYADAVKLKDKYKTE